MHLKESQQNLKAKGYNQCFASIICVGYLSWAQLPYLLKVVLTDWTYPKVCNRPMSSGLLQTGASWCWPWADLSLQWSSGGRVQAPSNDIKSIPESESRDSMLLAPIPNHIRQNLLIRMIHKDMLDEKGSQKINYLDGNNFKGGYRIALQKSVNN